MSTRNQREVKGVNEDVEYWEETMVKQVEFYQSYLLEVLNLSRLQANAQHLRRFDMEISGLVPALNEVNATF